MDEIGPLRYRSGMVFLSDFQIIRPRFEKNQVELLEWLAQAHAAADRAVSGTQIADEKDIQRMRKLFHRFGCGPEKISNRGTELSDGETIDFANKQIYRIQHHDNSDSYIRSSPMGVGMHERNEIFREVSEKIFQKFYAEILNPPDHLIHVTCTGYAAPSAAQLLVEQKNWSTKITHAYHMGCYAAFPAMRMATGFLAADDKTIDIIHNEICSLHMNPLNHAPEQLVVSSLFADGHVKYTLTSNANRGLRVLRIGERIIPSTRGYMTWNPSEWGMRMTLSKDVPGKVAQYIPEFLKTLDFTPDSKTLFAIHPGGPKIIDSLQSILDLTDEQVRHSRDVLYRYGNMSSATLPHIWKSILEDASIPSGQNIVSLAFGPGLTVFGAVLQKV